MVQWSMREIGFLIDDERAISHRGSWKRRANSTRCARFAYKFAMTFSLAVIFEDPLLIYHDPDCIVDETRKRLPWCWLLLIDGASLSTHQTCISRFFAHSPAISVPNNGDRTLSHFPATINNLEFLISVTQFRFSLKESAMVPRLCSSSFTD